MYLKKLTLENVGPLKNLDIEPSFDGERPKPLVFVGANGSGKSIALSFIVNFLLYMQQQIFENAEVIDGKVFKLRSPFYIGPSAPYYYGSVTFSEEMGLEEWQLSTPKKELVLAGVAPQIASWNTINQELTNSLLLKGEAANKNSPKLELTYNQNCILYFPPNRFEEPAWLNSGSLSFTPSITATQNFQGITKRKIISTNVFNDLLSWLYEIIIEAHIFEIRPLKFQMNQTGELLDGFAYKDGSNRVLINEINRLLEMIFEGKFEGRLKLQIGPKNARNIILSEEKVDGSIRMMANNLFSLSTGESLILSLFASIIRDYDLGANPIGSLSDVKGVVIVDEIDSHLHIDLQRKVLPRLIAAFPNVQFIVTTHSPLFLLGMNEQFGVDGYDIYSLPTAERIYAEEFSEFHRAYEEYKNTLHHKRVTKEMLAELAVPCLVTEGKTDRIILECAWKKLYGNTPIFLVIRSSGDIRGGSGSAKDVQSTLQYTAALSKYPIIGLFDNDREGNGQFGGLKTPSFVSISPDLKRNGLISALLLPAPQSRERFVHQDNGNYRFLEIEHYFSDAVLASQNKIGVEVIPGTGIFEIQGDKNGFAQSVENLEAAEFNNFHVLFCRLADILDLPHPQLTENVLAEAEGD